MHDCQQEGFLGEIKEFMQNSKGLKFTMFSLVGVMAIQVGTFLFLWGGLTNTVNKNTEHLWKEVDPIVRDNTRNIDKILAKFELITVIKGSQGEQGEKGEKGNNNG